MYNVPMAGMARRANSRRAGRLGLALILMGLVTESSSWILGASPGIGIPGICSFRSSHRVARKETTTTTTTPPTPMMTMMMMMMHRSRKPGLGCLEGYCQGRGVELPYRILGAVDVSLRGALRPGEGGDADKGEISGEVGENGDWDGRTSVDSKEAASAMVEKIRNLVKDGSPRKCLACLDGLAHEEDLGEDEKALVVEAVLRGLVKLSRFDLVADAWKVIKDAGLPASDHIGTVVVKAMCRSQAGGVWTAMKVIGELEERKSGSWKDVYPVVCQAAIRSRKFFLAQDLVARLTSSGDAVPVSTYNYLMKEFGKAGCLEGVFVILDAMYAAGAQPDAETVEFIANAAVRTVDFVTGAVSMDTLPEALPEACFAGRSNVGKSSLVNMVTNRKKLAFRSKTPGKTQQFNYFVVNKDEGIGSKFYLVDLPGVGYAEVPMYLRKDWIAFLELYLSTRPSLKVLFHLVDSRHGVSKDDRDLMKLYASSKCAAKYVIILTKVDKTDGKVRQSIVDGVRENLVECGCNRDTPVILTSSETKRGRDEVWSYLRLAALPEGSGRPTENEAAAGVVRELAEAEAEAKDRSIRKPKAEPRRGSGRKKDEKKPLGKRGTKKQPFNGQEVYVKPKAKKA